MLVTVTVIALMPLLFYYFVVRTYTYWTDKGVKQGKPLWLFGDSWGIFFKLQNFSEMIQYVYSQCPGTRYSGIYQFLIPTLVIKDPDLIKQVTVKDFDHFVDHRTFISEDTDPLGGKNLLFLKGQKWREMRAILSPSFTASKMRSMFELISECAENFVQYFLDKNEDTVPMEVKDSCTRYANDVIATTAFGVKVDSMREPDNEFYLMGKDMSSPLSGFLDNLKFFGYFIAPRLYKVSKRWKPPKALKIYLKSSSLAPRSRTFFMDMVDRTIKIREEQGIVRPDMIHLMMEARKGIDTELTFTQQSDMSKK
ncbi:hypothetical protein NQ318_019137 [Aromia moschata]|uniref:Cytochrome P450 n=1 Tax=Aromia moschata TaxID=1265417 RepID=A0AAV8YR68_9CUCU|nr:hypothetical protein NQ318_019137 [Aromia moschata]